MSKKERKAQEDAELDAIFGGMPTGAAVKAQPNEEKKESKASPELAQTDAAKAAKNKKKKER